MDLPVYDADLFTDGALAEPYDHYRALRDAGPVVWLAAHDLYAVARYDEVRAVLADPETFRSGQGVGFNDFINQVGQGTTLMSDGDQHDRLRKVIGRPLTPRALSGLRPDAQGIADRLVDDLLERGTLDAISDLAEVLPSRWVPDLLGWPAEGRDRLLPWANATFDGLGPDNARAAAAGAGLLELADFAHRVADSPLPAGSMAAGIQAAVRDGDLEPAQCPMAIIDYLGPALDTTIAAVGNAVWLLATHPEQWELLRAEPKLARRALEEAIRLESPISCFARVAAADTTVGGPEVPAGARVLVSFASANRDERRWSNPETFDINRESAGHVGFGHGDHACAGMGLARLEGVAVLSALAARARTIELAGEPTRKLNNLIRSFGSLPVRLTPA